MRDEGNRPAFGDIAFPNHSYSFLNMCVERVSRMFSTDSARARRPLLNDSDSE